MKQLRSLAPLVWLAGGLTAYVSSQAPMARSDRVSFLALVILAYSVLLLCTHAAVIVVRRFVGDRARPGMGGRQLPWEYLLLLLLLVANQALTAFGHKDVTYPTAGWLLRQGTMLQALVLAGVCTVLCASLLRLLRARWWKTHHGAVLTWGAGLATVLALLPPVHGRATGALESPLQEPYARLQAVAPAPLLLVGVDGLEGRLLRAALARGGLRQLKDLSEGYFALLDNDGFGHTPPVWTTIATGKPKSRHGIYDFVTRRSPLFSRPLDSWWEQLPPGFGLKTVLSGLTRIGLMQQRLVDGRDRNGPSIWQILSRFGLRTLNVNYPISYPAESVNGVFIASNSYQAAMAALEDADRSAALTGYSHPAGFLASSLERIQPQPSRAGDVIDLAWKEFEYLSLLALDVIRREGPFDFVTFYTPLIDHFNHRLSVAEYESMLTGCFDSPLAERYLAALGAIDSLLERLREAMPMRTNLLLISDHGVTTGFRQGRTVLQHRDDCPGVLLALRPGVAAPGASRQPSMYDISPTILTYFGAPAGRDMPGSVIPELLGRRLELVDTVASYDPWIPNARTATGGGELEAIRARLKALGYVQ